jgi:hypothetical protein
METTSSVTRTADRRRVAALHHEGSHVEGIVDGQEDLAVGDVHLGDAGGEPSVVKLARLSLRVAGQARGKDHQESMSAAHHKKHLKDGSVLLG